MEAASPARGAPTQQLDTTRADYEALRASKERELSSATAATRALAIAASDARADREVAQGAGALYESFWKRAREDARLAATDRDAARRELEAVRQERDAAIKTRDLEHAARADAERDRDAARARELAMQHRIEEIATDSTPR